MQTTNYNIRLDKQLKENAFNVFNSYGLTPSQAIKLFLNQVAETKVIPLSFDWKYDKPNKETRNAILEFEKEKDTLKSYSSLDEVILAMKNIVDE